MTNRDITAVRAIQDQELEGLRRTWEETPVDEQANVVGWLKSDDVEDVKEYFAVFGAEHVNFIQQAIACGLREAILQHAEE